MGRSGISNMSQSQNNYTMFVQATENLLHRELPIGFPNLKRNFLPQITQLPQPSLLSLPFSFVSFY